MANTDPVFALTPNVGQALLATANPARDGSGVLVDLFTAGANGSRVDKLIARALGSTTAGCVRIFLKKGAGTAALIEELPVDAVTVSAGGAGWGVVLDLEGGLVIPSGAKLQAATHNGEAFAVTAAGGDF